MAKSGFEVDFDGSFKRALRKLQERHKMTSAQIVNQALLDIAEKSFELTPKGDGQKIWDELRTPKSAVNGVSPYKGPNVAGRTIKGGKNKGTFQRYRQNRQLQGIHLISNYWRGKKGGKGLYGNAMMRYAGYVTRSRRGGVGSLKIAFLPAMRELMAFAKFKFSWSAKAKGIKRWPGSAGWGSVTPAKKSVSPEGMFRINRTPRSNQDGKVTSIYKGVIAAAIAWKRGNVIKKAEEMMRGDVDEFNRR